MDQEVGEMSDEEYAEKVLLPQIRIAVGYLEHGRLLTGLAAIREVEFFTQKRLLETRSKLYPV